MDEMSESRPVDAGSNSTITTRRHFLRLAGISVTAGAASLAGCAASPSLPQLVGAVQTVEAHREAGATQIVDAAQQTPKEMTELPWPYVALDAEETRKLGHVAYYKGHCSYGAFAAIVDQLAEKKGLPFSQIPTEMMVFGKGGVVGWGTLCGALLGASAAIALVVEEDDADKIINEMLEWYSQTPFPSEQSNQYASNHEFLVAEYKSDEVLPQTTSNSPLCHISVSQWCQASGYASGSKERSERCGRLTGDVAAHAVELLNAHMVDSFVPAFESSRAAQMCTGCHTKGENFEKGHFTQGKGECLLCHDPHK
jgi:hypothetical protein